MIAGCVPLIVHAPHYPLPPLTLVYSCCLALDIIRYIILLIRYCHLVLYDMSASVQFVVLVWLSSPRIIPH
jgi:hypothetical protein